jgi:hypothetical protein
MSSIADTAVVIQSSAQSVPSTPSWFGEATLIAHYLQRLGVLSALAERVRFARRRLGHYDLIDFVAVLLGYAISGEPTLKTFYERLLPFATPFMALFERDRLPARSRLQSFSRGSGPSQRRSLAGPFLGRSAGPTSDEGTTRWRFRSVWRAVARLRCRWDAPSGPPTRPPADVGPTCATTTLAGSLRPWLSRAQAR